MKSGNINTILYLYINNDVGNSLILFYVFTMFFLYISDRNSLTLEPICLNIRSAWMFLVWFKKSKLVTLKKRFMSWDQTFKQTDRQRKRNYLFIVNCFEKRGKNRQLNTYGTISKFMYFTIFYYKSNFASVVHIFSRKCMKRKMRKEAKFREKFICENS